MKKNETSLLSIPIWGIFIALIIVFLYFAQSIVIPIFFAIFTAFILIPIVKYLLKFHIPRTVSSALILIIIIGSMGALIRFISDPVTVWMERLPTLIYQVDYKLKGVKHSLESVQRTTEKIDAISNVGSGVTIASKIVTVKEPGMLFRLFNNAQDFLVGLVTMVVLTYLFLSFGHTLARSFTSLLRRSGYHRIVIHVAKDAQHKVSHYLLLITVINIGLGICVTIALWLAGLPNPIIWGVLAAMLNYIPYIGAAISIGIVLAVSLLTFNTIGATILPPLLVLSLNVLEGQFITPIFTGKLFIINPALIFLSVLFWGWLWGIAGVFLAVPILVVMVVSIHHVSLYLAGQRTLSSSENRYLFNRTPPTVE